LKFQAKIPLELVKYIQTSGEHHLQYVLYPVTDAYKQYQIRVWVASFLRDGEDMQALYTIAPLKMYHLV